MSAIIVGHDGSETSEAAVHEAVRLAQALDAPLHIVVAFKRDGGGQLRIEGGAWAVGGLEAAEKALADVETKYGTGIDITDSVSEEDPDDALVHAAERLGAQMIVVGNRRTQGLSRVLGSVAGAVVRKAPCSVHIAHTTG